MSNTRLSLAFIAGVFNEALGLGCTIGLLHAMAETTLLGLDGIRPTPMDLAIFVVLYCGAGVVVAGVVALAALAPPLQTILGAGKRPLSFRRTVWTILVCIYTLVFLRIVYYWSGWGVVLWLLAAAPSLVVASLAVNQKGHRTVVVIYGTALIAATLCALQLIHAGWDQEPPVSWSLAISLLVPVGICLVALRVVKQRAASDSRFESMPHAFRTLAVLVVVWAGVWGVSDAYGSLGRPGRGTPATTGAARPNFLLIVLDTVRADHLDLFGYKRETMPHLRQFAREECQFAAPIFTTASWTVPSHASMFTGLYSSVHGAHQPFVHDTKTKTLAYRLRDDKITLAERLGNLGYQTAGIVGNFGALSAFGLPRGFAYYDAAAGPAGRAPGLLWLHRFDASPFPAVGQLIPRWLPDALQSNSVLFSLREPPYRRASAITDRAEQWLEHNGGRPFFLFLNYFDAHFPYLPLSEDGERFAARPEGEEWRGFPTERYLDRRRQRGEFNDREKAFLIGQYDSELRGIDRQFDRLISYLRESGLLENTVIFVTADHGESQFEHGLIDHGNALYQTEIGGFLLVSVPGSLRPIEPSPLMQFVDFVPTILAILGERMPHDIQGSPWGEGRDYALSEVFCKPGALRQPDQWPDFFRRDRLAVVIDGQKLIRSTPGGDEVFDLKADPGEQNPLARPDPDFLRRAEEVIANRNKRLAKDLSENPDDPALLEKLRSLGYVR